MRCPYCGGLNQERAWFCVNCGRDLAQQATPNVQRQQQPAQTPHQPARQGVVPQSRPINTPGQQNQAQRSRPPAPQHLVAQPQQTQASTTADRRRSAQGPSAPPRPAPARPVPEPPAPFPPRTMTQFEALLAEGSQAYTLVESSVGDGKKQIISVSYPHCPGWQQAATLLKALKERQDEKQTIIIVRGLLPQQPHVYGFTNGQLQFDRNVRLGASISNRYIVETENGFADGSVRFVLNE